MINKAISLSIINTHQKEKPRQLEFKIMPLKITYLLLKGKT